MDGIFQIESFDSFQLLTEDLLKNLHSSVQVTGSNVDKNAINAAKDQLRKLIIKCNFDIDTVAEQMLNNKWDQERIQYFIALLKKNRTELYQSIITHHNSTYADTVIGFDWLLKLVLGSSESKNLKYPLLQLQLKSVNSNGDQKQCLYEMNKESLCKLINILKEYQENINNQN